MNSLYGIETAEDCRKKIDELLEMCHQAEQALNKETMTDLKSSLEKYYRKGNTQKGRDQMSWMESSFFSAAVRDAYVHAPKLTSPKTWREGLYEIELSLRYYRPKDHIE